jgi:thiol-disulfide isomerase/thioredoxin
MLAPESWRSMTEAKNEQKQDVPPPVRRPLRSLVIAGAALVVGAAVVYGIVAPGKKAGDTACAAAISVAERIAPLARGEVAALTVHSSPALEDSLTFEGADGQPKSLQDFRGRTVLLNLWATWCVPCREEMPALDKLQARLGGPDFEVVAVNIDTARLERRQTFLKEAGVTKLAFYADPKADVFQVLKRSGKVLGLPTTMLVDPQGCEIGLMPGPADWASDDAVKLVSAALGR